MFDLKGKNVLVVGGRGRLGGSFCQVLMDHGAYVISADISEVHGSQSNDQIEQKQLDVTNANEVEALVAEIEEVHNRIDILVYSVTGKTNDSYLPYTESSLDGWRHIINIELDGLYLMSQAVGRLMEEQKKGAMVFISSIYGMVANDHRIYADSNLGDVYNPGGKKGGKVYSPAVYNVVKAGVISLSRYLAAYWGEQGIRVNTISPGGISHPDENDAFVKNYAGRVPMARKAQLNEMDGALLYLASDAASYVTGHNLVVDGGWTAW